MLGRHGNLLHESNHGRSSTFKFAVLRGDLGFVVSGAIFAGVVGLLAVRTLGDMQAGNRSGDRAGWDSGGTVVMERCGMLPLLH